MQRSSRGIGRLDAEGAQVSVFHKVFGFRVQISRCCLGFLRLRIQGVEGSVFSVFIRVLGLDFNVFLGVREV